MTKKKTIGEWLFENKVMLIFAFLSIGGTMASGQSVAFVVNELMTRIARNAFTILSLLIPVLAGMGLNFGIVIGAMAGQIGVIFVRFFGLGGISGLLLAMLVAVPLSILFGWMTGILYNKTRGQETIAGLIVGYFANGLYYFLFLFVMGVVIKMPAGHPMIGQTGIGVRNTVDLGMADQGGLKYALDNILKIPFCQALILIAAIILILQALRFVRKKQEMKVKKNRILTFVNMALCVAVIAVGAVSIATKNSLTTVVKVPVVTVLLIVAACVFTELILKTKLGQDFKSVGQSQSISEVSGINVDRTRIIAVIISTVLASWGQIIFLQNVGTLNVYNAHTQVGMFAVASILVGGASTAKATVRQAFVGTILFNAMFIMSPEIGQAVFGQALLGEYFRTFMVYGVIGFALGLYTWKANRKSRLTI